jgi:hypothetical protein
MIPSRWLARRRSPGRLTVVPPLRWSWSRGQTWHYPLTLYFLPKQIELRCEAARCEDHTGDETHSSQ